MELRGIVSQIKLFYDFIKTTLTFNCFQKKICDILIIA